VTTRNALVTGASSGIGLAVTRRLLEQPSTGAVVAVSRNATRSEALAALQTEHPQRLLRMDVDLTDPGAIDALGRDAHSRVGALHLLFNAAGILHDGKLQPEKSLSQVSHDALARVFALNAFAPILLCRALVPCFRHGDPAILASLSARVGSIGDNQLGGWYAYRASKAAQNQLWKTLSIEFRRINRRAACVVLHPGTVDTPLSGPFRAGVPADRLFPAERAGRQLLDVIAGLGPEDSGRFIGWDGRDIPW
jgi:NAD(P)-dependent dehydrogenase (short-subunit alcohol dehydrogenase family)